jgi:hypothetical protein
VLLRVQATFSPTVPLPGAGYETLVFPTHVGMIVFAAYFVTKNSLNAYIVNDDTVVNGITSVVADGLLRMINKSIGALSLCVVR